MLQTQDFHSYCALRAKRERNEISKRNLTALNESKSPLNCLNCYSNKYGYCIETVPIDDKTNEIPTIGTLLME